MRTDTNTAMQAKTGFDLLTWTNEFWLNEDREIYSVVPKHLLQILRNETFVTSMVADESASELFLFKLVKKRLEFYGIPVVNNACLFISLVSNTPGVAVMFCVALALEWYDKTKHMQKFDVFDMAFLDQLLGLSPFVGVGVSVGIPSEDALHKAWDAQKVGGANALDGVTKEVLIDCVARREAG